MKIIKFKKAAVISSAFFLITTSAHSIASNASIKKDSEYTGSTGERLFASETTETEADAENAPENSAKKAESEERVAESDSEPNDAELMTNPEYKNKFAQIGDDEIKDNDAMPKFYDEDVKELEEKIAEETNPKEKIAKDDKNKKDEKSEENAKKIPEYKGTYGGSIRTIRPKEVVVSDEENKESEKIAEETKPTTTEEEKTEVAEVSTENAEVAENTEENQNEETAPEIVPSRSVAMKNGQYLEVTYPGKGWAFLGDDESKELLAFYGRKISGDDTTFTLRSKKAGDTLLHFYKIDLLTGQYIDDYLAVTVNSEVASGNEKNEKVVAPLYAEYVPPRPDRSRDNGDDENAESFNIAKDSAKNPNVAAAKSSSAEQKKTPAKDSENTQTQTSDANVKTNIQTSTAKKTEKPSEKQGIAKTTPQNAQTQTKNEQAAQNAQSAQNKEPAKQNETSSVAAVTQEPKTEVKTELAAAETKQSEQKKNDAESGNLFERAKKAYAEKRYSDALDLAQQYLEISVNDTDEVLYLLGQIWEAESSVKNIKFSINSYDALIKNYPMSNLWRKANQRLVYLKRFYVDIR
ncbi:MAG: hypothetical protein IKP49_09470 [Treponema sp.]|nr:hypothetical protein [Treponema sp.]